MKKILLVAIGLCFLSTSAIADTINFREGVFDPPDTASSFSLNVFTDFDPSLGLRFEAGPQPGAVLYWDSDDGFGVTSSVGYEPDEIEGPEFLNLFFSDAIILQAIHLTDFFNESGYLEIGMYEVDGESIVVIEADVLEVIADPNSNGDLWLDVGVTANYIKFTAPGYFQDGDHEFSVAGVEVAAVPIPGTVLLFASGLLGLLGLRKRVRKA